MAVELFLKRNKEQFDIIFDPPFPYKFHEDLVGICARQNTITENGLVIIHRPSERKMPDSIENLIRLIKEFSGVQ